MYSSKQDLNASNLESQQCHYNLTLIGFGKAVLGMAESLIELISCIPNANVKDKWKGILLVPKGSYKGTRFIPKFWIRDLLKIIIMSFYALQLNKNDFIL